MKPALICLFGCLGVMLRYGLNATFAKPGSLPWVTFWINISGSFFIGILYRLAIESSLIQLDLAAGLMVGLLGGFTTFSTFSLETVLLLQSSPVTAAFYFFGSTFFGVTAAMLGRTLARFFV